jgi:hypothetical protein
MKIVLLGIMVLCAQFISRGQAQNISEAPKAIQELSASIQGKSPDEVRAAIIERFGPAQRDIGSGFRIEQWDTSNGVLTFHPSAGPSFVDSETKKKFWLILTTNTVRDTIFTRYEMLTLPNTNYKGTRFVLGELELAQDMTYRLTDIDESYAQAKNFFLLCPTGKVEVRYVAAVTPDTHLESLAEGATIAHLTFTSNDGNQQATFSITSSESSRMLNFSADRPLSFVAYTIWKK